MKTKYISLIALLFFVVTQISSIAHAEFNSARAKKAVKATCSALLATTAGSAMMFNDAINLAHNRPLQVLGTTERRYGNRSAIHVLMARALGKKVARYLGFEMEDEDDEVLAIAEPYNFEEKYKDAAKKWTEEDFARGIYFSKQEQPEILNGFVMLPGFVGKFEAKFFDNDNHVELKIRTLSNDLVMKTSFKLAPRSV